MSIESKLGGNNLERPFLNTTDFHLGLELYKLELTEKYYSANLAGLAEFDLVNAGYLEVEVQQAHHLRAKFIELLIEANGDSEQLLVLLKRQGVMVIENSHLFKYLRSLSHPDPGNDRGPTGAFVQPSLVKSLKEEPWFDANDAVVQEMEQIIAQTQVGAVLQVTGETIYNNTSTLTRFHEATHALQVLSGMDLFRPGDIRNRLMRELEVSWVLSLAHQSGLLLSVEVLNFELNTSSAVRFFYEPKVGTIAREVDVFNLHLREMKKLEEK